MVVYKYMTNAITLNILFVSKGSINCKEYFWYIYIRIESLIKQVISGMS